MTETAAIVPLLEAAYGPNPLFADRLRTYLTVSPEGWIALDGSQGPLAFGGFVGFGRTAYIGLLAVAPAAQRRGLGAAVFEELLRRCEKLGITLLMLDASEAGAPLYERYGFRDRGGVAAYSFDTVLARRPSPSDLHVEVLGDDASRRAVAELDAQAFGADRTRLVELRLRELRGRCFLVRDASREAVGYCMAQAGSIGPCIAESADAARALIERARGLSYESPAKVLVNMTNDAAVFVMKELSASPVKRWRHMRRGDGAALGADWSRVFAKMSLAVG